MFSLDFLANPRYNYYVNLTPKFTLTKGDISMYIIFTENEALINYARKEGEQIVDLSKFKEKQFIITNEKSKRDLTIAENKRDLDSAITDLLLSLSISPHLKGFNYLKCSIYLSLTDDYYTKVGITKGIYPDTAKLFQTTTYNVERSIRIAIEHCFNDTPTEFLKSIFGSIVNSNVNRLTNIEFIFGIRLYLQKRYNF